MWRTRLLLAWAVLSPSCDKKEDAPRVSPPAAIPAPLPGEEPTTLPRDAGTIDLLHRTEVLIVASSHRDELSRAEFVADALNETAWRPNPPDPSPWLEFQFANEVEIKSFTVIPLDGQDTSSWAELVVSDAKPKRDESGGWTFEWTPPRVMRALRVALPPSAGKEGLRPSAKAVAIAEVRLLGATENEHLLPYALPEARVGLGPPRALLGNPKLHEWWRRAPYSSFEELCIEFARALGSADPTEQPVLGDTCLAPSKQLPLDGQAPGVVSAAVATFRRGDEISGDSPDLLVLRTKAGWYPANIWSADSSLDGSCPGMNITRSEVVRTFWEKGALSQERYRHHYPSTGLYEDSQEPPPVAVRSLLRCEPTAQFSCRDYVLAFGKPDVSFNEMGQASTRMPRAWTWERTYTVGSLGWLRFGPCVANFEQPPPRGSTSAPPASITVPCLTPGESSLP